MLQARRLACMGWLMPSWIGVIVRFNGAYCIAVSLIKIFFVIFYFFSIPLISD
jgi:hypothetical protein